MIKFNKKKFSVFCFVLLLPVLVLGECTCDTEEEPRDKSKALKYKIAAIASIFVAAAAGVCIPMLGRFIPSLHPEKDIFFIIKSFAAGVILSTGFVHVLPDAFEDLTNPCLKENPWGEFPFTGFVAMMATIGTLMIDAFATSYYRKSHFSKGQSIIADEEKVGENNGGHVHTHPTHGHSNGMILVKDSISSELLRRRVVSQVLELGILIHSLIVGISLGASENPDTIRPLFAALTFHQFFEGIGLGGCICQAKFKVRVAIIMSILFSLITPVGIAIGIGITNAYDENSPTALIVEGILNSASAGILIYMALVDLLAADFMNPKVQANGKLQFAVNIFLLLGAGFMSVLAKWA